MKLFLSSSSNLIYELLKINGIFHQRSIIQLDYLLFKKKKHEKRIWIRLFCISMQFVCLISAFEMRQMQRTLKHEFNCRCGNSRKRLNRFELFKVVFRCMTWHVLRKSIENWQIVACAFRCIVFNCAMMTMAMDKNVCFDCLHSISKRCQ